MPLQPPNLDNRTFEDLLQEARLRIPRYTPEWTDYNDSDPGMTLVQLFAWLTELMLFQMNQVPDLNYIKFLQLLDIQPRPARPATAYLTFSPQPNAVDVAPVPAGTQVLASPPDGGDPLIFETVQGLSVIPASLNKVFVIDSGVARDATEENSLPDKSFAPLGVVPQVGNALVLGFTPPESPTATGQPIPASARRPFPAELRLRVFLPISEGAAPPQRCGVGFLPSSPVSLVWEYRSGVTPRWKRLTTYEDGSAAFTREGTIVVEGPQADITATTEPWFSETPLLWLRCRLADEAYPAGQEPVIDLIQPNTVKACNLSTVRDELVGTSDGGPDQVFTLARNPVMPDSLELLSGLPERPLEEWALWSRVADFLASTADDMHFLLDATSGEITFGDGTHGSIPPAGYDIVAAQYQYGGGKAGNVDANLIVTPLTTLTGVGDVTNVRPAVGGADAEPLEEVKRSAPQKLSCRNRAVTREDYAAIAQETGGVARAFAIAGMHPDHPGVDVPGAVTVIVIPESADPNDPAPKPTPALLQSVCEALDGARVLTAEVYVKGPDYVPVTVEARIEAERYASVEQVTRDAIAAINAYLDPLGRSPSETKPSRPGAPSPMPRAAVDVNSAGEFDADHGPGWWFGRVLNPTDFYGVIRDVAGVAAVRTLFVSVNDQEVESITKAVSLPPDALVYGRDHQIDVVPQGAS